MARILAILSSDRRVILSFRLITISGEEELSSSELEDFVDSDIPLIYETKKMSVNDYFGESKCSSIRQRGHSF